MITTPEDLKAAEERLKELQQKRLDLYLDPRWRQPEHYDAVLRERASLSVDIKGLFDAIEQYKTPVLHKLRKGRVFDVHIAETNEAVFGEMCDECFAVALSKEELGKLIAELEGIRNRMEG